MHLHLSLPAHLVDHPAFAGGPFTRTGSAVTGNEEPVTTEAQSGEDDDDDSGSSTLGAAVQIGIFLLIPIGMYFLMIRPQRRRAKQQQALQRSIGVGDEVMLNSGMYGFVTAMETDTDVVWVEVDDDVQVRVARGAISGKVNVSAAADESAESSSDAADSEPDDE